MSSVFWGGRSSFNESAMRANRRRDELYEKRKRAEEEAREMKKKEKNEFARQRQQKEAAYKRSPEYLELKQKEEHAYQIRFNASLNRATKDYNKLMQRAESDVALRNTISEAKRLFSGDHPDFEPYTKFVSCLQADMENIHNHFLNRTIIEPMIQEVLNDEKCHPDFRHKGIKSVYLEHSSKWEAEFISNRVHGTPSTKYDSYSSMGRLPKGSLFKDESRARIAEQIVNDPAAFKAFLLEKLNVMGSHNEDLNKRYVKNFEAHFKEALDNKWIRSIYGFHAYTKKDFVRDLIQELDGSDYFNDKVAPNYYKAYNAYNKVKDGYHIFKGFDITTDVNGTLDEIKDIQKRLGPVDNEKLSSFVKDGIKVVNKILSEESDISKRLLNSLERRDALEVETAALQEEFNVASWNVFKGIKLRMQFSAKNRDLESVNKDLDDVYSSEDGIAKVGEYRHRIRFDLEQRALINAMQ